MLKQDFRYIAPMTLWVVDQANGQMIAPNITQTYGVAVSVLFPSSVPRYSRLTSLSHMPVTLRSHFLESVLMWYSMGLVT